MKKASLILLLALALPVSAASSACIRLSSDLSRGASGIAVTTLQTFLRDSGYLFASPNGHFGPATFSAVQAFQKARGISMTGTVGPLTRKAIESESCTTVTNPVIPPVSASTSPTQSSSSVSPRSNVIITSPWEGTTLTIGSSHTIRWGGAMSVSDALVLEDEGGATRGYVAFFPGTSEEYRWDVGRVSVGDTTEFVGPGTYRIRVQDKSRGAQSQDPKSRLFTLVAPELSISSVTPSALLPDGKSSAVIFGKGFTRGTRLYLGASREHQANVLFVSPDGTILVFSVPDSVPRGLHRLVIRTSYSTLDDTTSIRVH